MKKRKAVELVKKRIIANLKNYADPPSKGIYGGHVFADVDKPLISYFKTSEIYKIVRIAENELMNEGRIIRIYYTGCDDYHWKMRPT